MQEAPLNGWITAKTQWAPPKPAGLPLHQARMRAHAHAHERVQAKGGPRPSAGNVTKIKSGPADWPGVEWPSFPQHNIPQNWDGEGDWGSYYLGVGGA